MKITKVGIIGAGAWGTALATSAARAGLDVLIWAYETEVVHDINQDHENKTYLKNVKLDTHKIKATHTFEDFKNYDLILFTAPVQNLRLICEQLVPFLSSEAILLLCCKGIEISTARLPSEILYEFNPKLNIGVLSGPSFARDVALNLPTALTLAYPDHDKGMQLCQILSSPKFRPYYSSDIIGAQIGGAIKNIIAIGCGIIIGKKWGDNAKAALITRGLSEMVNISKAYGGNIESLMGLCGIGDLTLTCNSLESRNMSLGFALGQGTPLDEYLKDKKTVCEGLKTIEALIPLKTRFPKLELPTCEALHEILINKANIDEILEKLLSRPLKEEMLCA